MIAVAVQSTGYKGDMSNIRHRVLHSDINSYGMCLKGEAIDPVAGEWSGVNEVSYKERNHNERKSRT